MANEYRANALHAEVIAGYNADARIHALYIEVVRSIDETPLPTGGRRRQGLVVN